MKTILILYNKKGMTLMECIIALVLTTTAIVSLMTMQSLSWKGAGKSDYLGRAEGILQRELETKESNIMWGTPPSSNTTVTTCADASGNTIACGGANVVFTITYKPTIPSGAVTTYLINVKVTWLGSANGIKSSIIVSKVS
jgi:hypothetical protein